MATAQNDNYWMDVVSAFPLLCNEDEIPEPCDDETFENVKKMITERKLTNMVSANVMHRVINNMNFNMTNSFWLHFLNEENVELSVLRNSQEYLATDISGFEKFRSAVDGFFQLAQSHIPTVNRIQMLHEEDEINIPNHFYNRICALMHSQLPIKYKTIVYHFYRTGLRIIYYRANPNNFDITSYQCSGCFFDKTNCNCDITMQAFNMTNWQLSSIGVMELLAEDVIVDVLGAIIENEVAIRIIDNFGDSLLPILFHWLCNIIFGWIKEILDPGCSSVIYDCRKLDTVLTKLKLCLYKSFTTIRINHIYDIIIRFPYSEPAVDDLTVALRYSKLNLELYELLQNSLKNKLLQSDMNTLDILYVYTSTIRVLRKVDPTGAILAEIAKLIQGYLREREDTVHQIISMLITNGSNEWLRTKTILEEDYASLKNCGQHHCTIIRNSYTCDIIALLIDLSGSREIFAREYRVSLADRLLISDNVDRFIKEIKYLKLIEARVGEQLLSSCSMMLKDIDSSKCVNKYLYHEPSSNGQFNICKYDLKFTVKGIIVSEHYWPKLEDEYVLKLPDVFLAHLDVYKKCYEAYKRNRTLIWNPNLGKIEMDIVINQKCLSVIVSPVQATVLWNFQNREEWTIDDLSTKMNVPSTSLMVFITFWINKGVLKRKSFDTFILLKNLPRGTPDYVPVENEDALNYVYDEHFGAITRNNG